MPDREETGPRRVPSARILLVEDNRDAAEMLRGILEMQGHAVRIEPDGPGAIEAVESFDPEVVLLDIGLPGMNGHEVAKRIREQSGGKDLLIVALTGYAQPEEVERSKVSGIDHHLVKPMSPGALEELLHRRLGRAGLDPEV